MSLRMAVMETNGECAVSFLITSLWPIVPGTPYLLFQVGLLVGS